jgi:FkbM family methyltransferase
MSDVQKNAAGSISSEIWSHLLSSRSQNEFLGRFFGSATPTDPRFVIQVGANDGEMCDPLRPYLAKSDAESVSAVLIEPVPYYVGKLEELYRQQQHIQVVNAACSAKAERRTLYYIDPAMASLMNGDGPDNDWAHGQGSFDRDTIVFWIEQNRFRGAWYNKNISKFIDAIQSLELDVIPLSSVPLSNNNERLCLVIDVQGFEYDVLCGVNWSAPPAFVIYEDDMGKGQPVADLLTEKGYHLICGDIDKVYARS